MDCAAAASFARVFSIIFRCIAMFWSFGLLLVYVQYRNAPRPATSHVGQLVYSWHVAMGSIGAVFLTVWFAFLALMTVVAPVMILMSNAS